MLHTILCNAAQTTSEKVSTFAGLSEEAWINVLVGVIAAVFGGVITYFAQWGLQARVETIRLHGKLTEKRVDAYEQITTLLNLWGSVVMMEYRHIADVFEDDDMREPSRMFMPHMRSIVFENKKTFEHFVHEWHQTVQLTHMWVDSDVMAACRRVSWYFSSFFELIDTSFLPQSNLENMDDIIGRFLCKAGAITFDDYHMFADPIYKLIAEKMEKPKLKIKKSSLREINGEEKEEFFGVLKKTKLSKYNDIMKIYFVMQFGYDKAVAQGLIKLFAP